MSIERPASERNMDDDNSATARGRNPRSCIEDNQIIKHTA